jgi:hypothetical protein
MKPRTCKIIFGKNTVPQREGRPDYNGYHPSRKRLLALGRPVGRKARRVRATA